MADKGILLNTSMVQATLANRKNQTRRLNGLKEINACPDDWNLVDFSKDPELMRSGEEKTFIKKGLIATFESNRHGEYYQNIKCPWEPGDVLYVRETWNGIRLGNKMEYWHKAGNVFEDSADEKWRPSIHMPREAARLFLKVKDVRVERLHNITEEDTRSEGFNAYIIFTNVWDDIYLKRGFGWEMNPWIWVITFDWRAL